MVSTETVALASSTVFFGLSLVIIFSTHFSTVSRSRVYVALGLILLPVHVLFMVSPVHPQELYMALTLLFSGVFIAYGFRGISQRVIGDGS